jgi:hypothetical protein
MRRWAFVSAMVALAALPIWLNSAQVPNLPGAPVALAQESPVIFGARIEGKRLIVTGDNFTAGAAVFLNGQREKTKNLAGDPGHVLVAKKAGKRIGPTDFVTLQVQNPNTALSQEFMFFGGPTYTLADNGKTVGIRMADQFLLALASDLDWTISLSDQSVVVTVPTLIAIPGAQGLFEAVKPGTVILNGRGDRDCDKPQSPCPQGSVDFKLTMIVQ